MRMGDHKGTPLRLINQCMRGRWLPVELTAGNTTQEMTRCLPDLFRIVIITPEIITGNFVWFSLHKTVKSRFQRLLILLIYIKVLEPELAPFTSTASCLYQAGTPFLNHRHIFPQQLPKEMSPDRVKRRD